MFKSVAVLGNKYLFDHFIALGVTAWNDGLKGACIGGHKDLVQFFIEKGAVLTLEMCNMGLERAIKQNDMDLIMFFMGKSSPNHGLLEATKIADKNLVLFFIEKGANNFNFALQIAISNGHQELIDFFISKGAENWTRG